MPETFGFGDSPIEGFRAASHAPDNQEEAMTPERDCLENRRLDALVPATGIVSWGILRLHRVFQSLIRRSHHNGKRIKGLGESCETPVSVDQGRVGVLERLDVDPAT